MATRILYEVTARCRDAETAERWARLMTDEHIADVVAAGAMTGRMIQLDDIPHTFVVQYEFESRESLDRYLREQSPGLRAAVAREFNPEDVTYERRTGAILT